MTPEQMKAAGPMERLLTLLIEAQEIACRQTTAAGTHITIYGHILSARCIVERIVEKGSAQ